MGQADELERRWNDALTRVRSLEQRVEQEEVSLAQLAPVDIEEVAHLASDLDQIWNGPAADVRLNQRITRILIEMVIVDVEEPTNEVVAVIHWKGGVHTERRYPRRRSKKNIGYPSEDIVEAVRILSRVCADPTKYGAFSAVVRARWRRKADADDVTDNDAQLPPPSPGRKQCSSAWAVLLFRTWGFDPLDCPDCPLPAGGAEPRSSPPSTTPNLSSASPITTASTPRPAGGPPRTQARSCPSLAPGRVERPATRFDDVPPAEFDIVDRYVGPPPINDEAYFIDRGCSAFACPAHSRTEPAATGGPDDQRR